MGRYIIKLKDCYLEYSSIVDAPTTFGMSLKEFKKFYRAQYGENGIHELEARLERVKQYGTSAIPPETAESFLSGNRAGPDESELTPDEIYQAYCVPPPPEWLVS